MVLPTWITGYIAGCYALGFEAAMTAMVEDEALFFYICDRFASGDALFMQQLAEAGAEAVFIADSWASCDVISPAFFRRFGRASSAAASSSFCAAVVSALAVANSSTVSPVAAMTASS